MSANLGDVSLIVDRSPRPEVEEDNGFVLLIDPVPDAVVADPPQVASLQAASQLGAGVGRGKDLLAYS